MRIVIDATAAESGGRVYLTKLLPELAQLARGHEFIVFHKGDFDGWELDGFRFQRGGALANSKLPWLGKAVWKLLWRLFVFPQQLRRTEADVLFSNAGFAPFRLPRGMKLVTAQHNSMPLRAELIQAERSRLRRWRLRILRRLLEKAMRRGAATIVFSQDAQQRALDNFKTLPRAPVVIQHGMDWGAAERRQPVDSAALQRLGLAQPYLLYVSQFHRYKNVETLLEAFAQVSVRQPQLSLALVGEAVDKSYWRELEQQLARLGLTERVKHLPGRPRAELLDIYRGALAFVHPSLAEACPFPLLEALALGAPVAAARASALPELAGEAAVYFAPHDAAELAAVLERLLDDAALRAELSCKAVLRAERFSWRACAEQTWRVLEQAARGAY